MEDFIAKFQGFFETILKLIDNMIKSITQLVGNYN